MKIYRIQKRSVWQILSFTDLEAISIAYKGAEKTFIMGDSNTPNEDFWAYLYLVWPNLLNMQVIMSMYDIVGFDFFDVKSIASYGMSDNIFSSGVLYISGNLDFERIKSAYKALGFENGIHEGVEVWYGSGGLDSDSYINNNERIRENPFGGDTGRKQPMVFGSNFIVSSSSPVYINQYIDKENSIIKCILENPIYAAAAAAAAAAAVVVVVVNSVPKDSIVLQARII